MVCEFLPVEYKRKLLELATIDDLVSAGYQTSGAYKAKEKLIISDERCEKLIAILGKKAQPVLIQALQEFASQIGCQVNCP